jgi:hypothetical protein
MATNMTKSVETLRQRAIASGDDRNGYWVEFHPWLFS